MSYVFYNNFRTATTGTLLIAGTSVTVTAASPLVTPSAGQSLPLTLTSPSDSTLVEIVAVTAVSVNTLTITRAQEGTTAREWPAGTIVSARVTAAMMGDLAQVDNGGNARGTNAIDLQSGRTVVTQVASGARSFAAGYGSTSSGQESVAVGDAAVASGTGSIAVGDAATAGATGAVAHGDGAVASSSFGIAIGSAAGVTEPSQLTAWPATTAVVFGSIYRLAANSGLILYCIRAGTTGASEPAPSGAGTVVDGTATWSVIDVLSGGGSKAQAFGSSANAVGSLAVSLGGDSIARGHSSIAIGGQAKALGRNAIAIGPSAEAHGSGSIVLGRASIGDRARATPGVTMIGSEKYTAFAYASHIRGLEFIDQHGWWYTGAANVGETVQQTTKEVTLYSIPVQLGNAAWPGAAATVKHGHSIRVGSYIYTAFIYNSDYFDSGTTGGVEPIWPTTPGDDVADGDFDWICVGTSIEWLMPDYARFVPVSVGAIARESVPGGGVTYPQITSGPNGAPAGWLAATTLSKLTGNYSQHLIDPTNTEGAKQFGISLTTAGGDLNCVAVLVVKGYVVESDVA